MDAKDLLRELDDAEQDAETYMEDHLYTNSHKVVSVEKEVKTINGREIPTDKVSVVTKDEVVQTVKRKLKKGCRSKFACAISKLAYNKFGERPMSEANSLITRKWIQKLLEEPLYRNLRVCDKNIAIDRALFLSFVPTKAFQEMKMMSMSRPWEARMKTSNAYGGFWSKVCFIACLPSGEECQ
jgi:hypothetical protein